MNRRLGTSQKRAPERFASGSVDVPRETKPLRSETRRNAAREGQEGQSAALAQRECAPTEGIGGERRCASTSATG